jgi:hypothetical protein
MTHVFSVNRADGPDAKVSGYTCAGELLADDPELGKGKCDTLSHLGIERHQSSRWQRIASIGKAAFDTYLAETIAAGRELTTAGAMKLAKREAMRPEHADDADEGKAADQSGVGDELGIADGAIGDPGGFAKLRCCCPIIARMLPLLGFG